MALIDDVITAISEYRDQAVTALNSLANFRPTIFTPAALEAPSLAAPSAVTPAAITPFEAVGTSLTNPNNLPYTPLDVSTMPQPGTPYVPLTSDALPSYAPAETDTGLMSSFASANAALQPTLFSWLYGAVQGIIESGGADISTTVQAAIFGQGDARAVQIAQDALDLTGARTGSKGFRYPNSMTRVLQAQIALNHTWQRNDLSLKIVEKMADLAQRNMQAAIQAGVSLDDAKARVFATTQSALTDVHRVIVEKYRADLQGNLQEFEGQLQVQLADLGVQRADREEMRAYVSAQLQAQLADLDVQKADRDEMRAFVSAQREQLSLETQANTAEFEAKAKAEFMRVETDRMISELVRSGNEQAIRLFSAQAQQHTEILRASIVDAENQNQIAVGILENVAKTYVEMMNSLSGQGVAVDITKH